MQNTELDRTAVAVGLIFDSQRRILIGQRTNPDMYKGKWEFPGGKVKPLETASEALSRELWEEIGITVTQSVPFMKFNYDYPDRKVLLDFRVVDQYEGEPVSREQQAIRWVELSKLKEIDMLAPNIAVIETLQKQYR